MALSGTMSNPNDWLQFYNLHNNTVSSQPLPLSSSSSHRHVILGQNQDQTTPLSHHMHDSTVVSTTTTPPSSSALLNPSSSNNNNNNNNNSLSPEGRVSKPVRKRTRASRRTPTTLLNTDTANFSAMVQQFTGAPTAASFAPQHAAASGFGFRQQGFVNSNPNNAPMMMPPLGFNTNHQQSPYVISLNNNNINSNINSGENLNHPQGFVGRLMSQSIRPVTNMGVSFSGDEFSSSTSRGQGQPEQRSVVGSGRRPNSSDTNENRSNSVLY